MKRAIVIMCLITCQCCAYAQHWQALSSWPNRAALHLYTDTVTDNFYVAGQYSQIGNRHIRGIGIWNGSQWDSLQAGIDAYQSSFPQNTNAIARYNNELIVGGAFSDVNYISSQYLAWWDGTQWHAMYGGQPNSVVDDVLSFNGNLYICGAFDSIGNVAANCIAEWNGSNWQAIGNNYNFSGNGLYKIVPYKGNLYIEGNFFDPFGNHCRLAKWDGSSWQFFSTALTGNVCFPFDMVVYDNKLYVGGQFFSSDGNAGTAIICWNDTTWTDVGGSAQIVSNPYPTVWDMCVHNNKLYCAGTFEEMGGISAKGLASWDGTQWCGFNTNFEGQTGQYTGTYAVGFWEDTMYVGGNFYYADTSVSNYIAKWVGGNYVDTCGTIATGMPLFSAKKPQWVVFPNPASNYLTVQISAIRGRVELSVCDVLGRSVINKQENDISGTQEEKLDISSLQNGIYFISLKCDYGQLLTKKIIVQRY